VSTSVLVMVGDDAQSFKDIDQKVLCMSYLRGLSAYSRNLAAGASGGFLTLETKHFLVHSIACWVSCEICRKTTYEERLGA
jgi:hypothetical protein